MPGERRAGVYLISRCGSTGGCSISRAEELKGEKMKALRKVKSGKGANWEDIDMPQIGEDDLVVRVKATALCKSDVDVYEWTSLVAGANYPLPITMGHEFVGEIVEVGKHVKNFLMGDHITGETHIPCGYCHSCRMGNGHICSNNMGVLGRTVDGSFAEYIRIPEVSAIKIDKEVPISQGALMEPFGTAVHAVMKGEVSGKSVIVLGCGTIGLMAVELSRLLGATKVIAVSRTPAKLEDALHYGADVAINTREHDLVEVVMDETHDIGVGVAIETTGDQKIINQVMKILEVAGRCVFVGMIDYPLTFDGFMNKVVYKELILTGIFGRRLYETWETVASILQSGRIDLSHYVAAELPLVEFKKGIDMFSSLSGRVIFYP